MIIFESTSKFKIREIKQLYPHSIKLALIFMLFNLIFLSLFTHLLFHNQFTIPSILLSLLFSAIMSGTSPDVVLTILKEKKQKLAEILEIESIINTPITVLIPLIILNIYQGIFQAQALLTTFLQSIMTGIGAGLFLGLVSFRLMKKQYLENISPLVVIALALISYSVAEYLGGSGVLSVTVLGLIFGQSILKEKEELQKFTAIFTNFLKIIVFVLLGVMLKIPFTFNFLLKATILFTIYLAIRYLAVHVTFLKQKLEQKEKLFMTFNVSKGVAVAVVVFILSAYNIPELTNILSLSYIFILYSIVLASITGKFTNQALKKEVNLNPKNDKNRASWTRAKQS